MSASSTRMTELARLLWQNGIAAFCPTTLSSPPHELKASVTRIGAWIRQKHDKDSALPLGIHLEGPFIAPGACGAHPPQTIRKLDLAELEDLWNSSQKTLKILTVAPETLSQPEMKSLTVWARARKLVLSLGHSRATEAQAREAFASGFRGVTHAWNALPFHHRSPGPLGAAIGDPKVYLELILDQIHVSPTLIRWTLGLHPARQVAFISDCVPSAATDAGSWHPFGSLQVQLKDGASRLAGDHLAGGGLLLSEAYCRWVETETKALKAKPADLIKKTLICLTEAPLRALGLSPLLLKPYRAEIHLSRDGKVRIIPRA